MRDRATDVGAGTEDQRYLVLKAFHEFPFEVFGRSSAMPAIAFDLLNH
jgi:hypothetical protein